MECGGGQTPLWLRTGAVFGTGGPMPNETYLDSAGTVHFGAGLRSTANAVSPLGRCDTHQSKIQNPKSKIAPVQNAKSKIASESSGAALIIAVAIFAVLLFIALTFWSASRIEHSAAVRHQEGYRGELLASAGQALAVSHLRLDKKWHPTYTSLDHGWNTVFNGAWLAGKPWAFKPDPFGTRVLDRTWTNYGGATPYKRVPYIDYWTDVKIQEAELDLLIQRALFTDGIDGINNDGDANTDEADEVRESLGSALAQIKNPLFVPRFQIDPDNFDNPSVISLLDQQYAFATTGDPADSDFLAAFDWPVQYAYDFTNYNPALDNPLNIPDADLDPFAAGWPARNVTPQQKINWWADVDCDGDGLRDAMWIPIGVEVFFGGIDRNGDGRVSADKVGAIGDEGGDGIDNDLDGQVDEPDETAVFVYWGGNDDLDNDQDGDIDEADEQRVYLTAPLVADSYWGGNDGEDNDHDGLIDEADEQRIFLTSDDRINNNAIAPRTPASLPIVTAGEGIDYQDPGESIPLLDTFYVRVDVQTLNEYIAGSGVTIGSDTDARLQLVDPGDPIGPAVDRVDNDFTQIVNDTHGHVFLEPTTPQLDVNGVPNPEWVAAGAQENRARSYARININPGDPRSYSAALSGLVLPFFTDPDLVPVITCAGETVCTVAGRVAVHITDEASKVNLNTAGAMAVAMAQDVSGSTALGQFVHLRNAELLTFARNEGVSTGEYDARVLPDIGVQRALDVFMTRNGEHKDDAGGGKPQNFPSTLPIDATDFLTHIDANDSDANGAIDNVAEAGYSYDSQFPGYGRADDNANALELQFNGLDDDGDGAYYVHDGIDNDFDGITDEPDEARFGIDEPFEGIDEPQELQMFRPFRNRLAELDGIDNDLDGAVDEIGELGDRLYSTGDEMAGALSSVTEMAPLRPVLTVQSSDPNARYQHYIGGAQGDLARNIPPDTAPVTGMKLDYNFATADAIANALREDWSYPAIHDALVNEIGFPPVPVQAPLAGNPYLISASIYAPTGSAAAYVADFRFEAAYLAGLRRESVTVVGAPIGMVDTRVEAPLSALALTPGRVLESDAGLRAYQLALNIADARDTDRVRNTITYKLGDQWWSELFRDPGIPAGQSAPAIREIGYTMSGVEGIRINEIMARAVRRVEAESNYDPDPVGDPRPENNPNLFAEFAVPNYDFDVTVETIEQRAGAPLGTGTPSQTVAWEYFPQPSGVPFGDRVGLGDRAGWRTDSDTVNVGGTDYDNVIQFRIGPSAQLPPGRYYLLINTIDENGNPTAQDGLDVDFRVKYVLNGGTDLLGDVAAFATGGGTDPFGDPNILLTRSEPWEGHRNAADPTGSGPVTGMVFLPTQALRPSLSGNVLPVGFEGYSGIPGEDELQSEAYTIIVPPFATNAAEQFYVCIGIRNPNASGQLLAVNFLDFSQEPDHEWVEIVNVSASPDPIDLSDWLLEVGGGTNDPTTVRYRIPAGTRIVKDGSLLLTTNKYDNGPALFSALGSRIFANNGMGMASQPASVAAPFGTPSVGVSEPPIPRYATRADGPLLGFNGQPLFTPVTPNQWNGRWGEAFGAAPPNNAESVFQRPPGGLIDFLDLDGDGQADAGIREDDLWISTIDNPLTDTTTKAWDRIVQVEPVGANPLTFANDGVIDPLSQLATVVLRGGMLPNYPENDLVDNDGDNPELMRDGIDNDGDRLLFDNDDIDNDGDGLFDEGSDLIDNNGNGLIDESLESEGTDDPIDPRYDYDGIDNGGLPGADEGSDGIDNGGLPGVVDDFGESESPLIPEGADEGGVARWLKYNPVLGPLTQVPGSFHRTPQFVLYPGEPAWVEGTNSTPEWKEFTERRMFPGDAVRVTLYERFPEEAFIVDRVTYTQNDVENRSPDDVRSIPVAAPDALLDRFVMLDGITGLGLNRAWPENTMGVDFYRSLERKHPLYTGDRFGLANRWTATDGNYDDWGPGTNRWFWDNVADVATPMVADLEFGPAGAPTAVSGVQFFAHGFSGSPLRPNFLERVLTDIRLGYDPNPPMRLVSNDAPVVPDALVGDNQRIITRARVRDANFRSPGDLLTVPYLAFTRSYTVGEYDVLGREALQGPTVAPEDMLVGPVPPHLKGASIGTAYPEDLRALIDTASFDSIVLNVGQADFYPLYPYVPSLIGGGQTELAQWSEVGTNAYRAPRAWAPVFLASLDPGGFEPEGADFSTMATITLLQDGTRPTEYPHMLASPGYPIQLAFLYRNFDLSVVQPYANTAWLLQDNVGGAGSLASTRWPLERRALMYVSTNPDGFLPDQTPHNIVPGGTGAPALSVYPSEALFVWDGADGLPNGEYDLYVVTMPDMTQLQESTRAFDLNRNDWLPAKLASVRRRLPIDIQVLTDKDGDRKCWMDGTGPTANLPDTSELGLNTLSAGPADQREKFPLKAGLVPASDGTVHYGVVKIENNFLGVFVRNWAAPGVDNVNAVSRVVLMSRDRTPGRINLNTAITQPLATNLSGSPDINAFNPLTGLVGFMAEYIPDTDPLSDQGTFAFAPWSDRIPVDTGPPYTFGLGDYGSVLARANQITGPSALAVANPAFLPRGERFVDYNSDGLPDPPIDINGDGGADLAVRFDGRYLLSPAELIVSGDEAAFASRPFALMPSMIPQYFDVAAPTANQKAQQFDQAMERYTRMGNSITTLSDTFEIIVTAQSGYAFDANRDGVINWRDDAEFVVSGEKKLRTVYER